MVDILYIRSIFDFTMDTAEIDGAHQSHALFPDQKMVAARKELSFQRSLNAALLCLD